MQKVLSLSKSFFLIATVTNEWFKIQDHFVVSQETNLFLVGGHKQVHIEETRGTVGLVV